MPEQLATAGRAQGIDHLDVRRERQFLRCLHFQAHVGAGGDHHRGALPYLRPEPSGRSRDQGRCTRGSIGDCSGWGVGAVAFGELSAR
jgi:hypothetical protein